LRTEPAVQSFIKQINGAGKPMAVICHAPWGLVPSGPAPRPDRDQHPPG
jgi:putative intracellular protease/amidase